MLEQQNGNELQKVQALGNVGHRDLQGTCWSEQVLGAHLLLLLVSSAPSVTMNISSVYI